ncbi:hypothetical protein GS854_01640 [Rhodococcus hoagii]|nr:hypothetical protein [Prescottella equi]
MTDTITPASLRAHADWFASKWPLVCEALNDEAARLEAESARDEEAEKYAKVAVEADAHDRWGDLPPEDRADVIVQIRAVLDRLAADGRLLPEGGTGEAGRTADASRMQAEFARASARMERLPNAHRPVVTPPAVSVPDSGPEDPCGGTGTVECWNPGGLCTEKVCELCGPCRTCDPNAPILFANSGPDGTPEKPWPTWQDVPEGAEYRGSFRDGSPTESRWINRDGVCTIANPGRHYGQPETWRDFAGLAPFVRVDGDKA